MNEGPETLLFPVHVTVSQRFPTHRFAAQWIASPVRKVVLGKGDQALFVNDVEFRCNAFMHSSESLNRRTFRFKILAQGARFPTSQVAPIFDDPLFEVLVKRDYFELESIGLGFAEDAVLFVQDRMRKYADPAARVSLREAPTIKVF